MPGGGNAQNHGENHQGVPAQQHVQAGVPVLGVQGQGAYNQGQDNAQNAAPQQAAHGAANHGLHEQQVLSVWGDLTETQEDRVMNQYDLNNMDTVKGEEEVVMGYKSTNIPGKWS